MDGTVFAQHATRHATKEAGNAKFLQGLPMSGQKGEAKFKRGQQMMVMSASAVQQEELMRCPLPDVIGWCRG